MFARFRNALFEISAEQRDQVGAGPERYQRGSFRELVDGR